MIQIKMQNKDFRRDTYQQVLDLSTLIIHMMALLLQYGGMMVDGMMVDGMMVDGVLMEYMLLN